MTLAHFAWAVPPHSQRNFLSAGIMARIVGELAPGAAEPAASATSEPTAEPAEPAASATSADLYPAPVGRRIDEADALQGVPAR